MQHLRLAVVEAARVPGDVIAAVALVEVLVGGAVEARQALDLVVHRVRVHEVHDDRAAQAVGGVDQGLQFLRRAEARRAGEEVGHVVAERAVVGVLLTAMSWTVL